MREKREERKVRESDGKEVNRMAIDWSCRVDLQC